MDAKSDEITAIPLLLERLELEGALVTIDAIGTQTAVAETIRVLEAQITSSPSKGTGQQCTPT